MESCALPKPKNEMTSKLFLAAILLFLSQMATAFGLVPLKSQTVWCDPGYGDKVCSSSAAGLNAAKFYQIYGPTLASQPEPPASYRVDGGVSCQILANNGYPIALCGGLYFCSDGGDGRCTVHVTLNTQYEQMTVPTCPENSSLAPDAPGQCRCNKNFASDGASCIPHVDELVDAPLSCSSLGPAKGNPIFPISGAKQFSKTLGHWLGQDFYITYNSRYQTPAAGNVAAAAIEVDEPLGVGWGMSGLRYINVQVDPVDGSSRAQVVRGPGKILTFVQSSSGSYRLIGFGADTLVKVVDGWMYFDQTDLAVEKYDTIGRLTKRNRIDGQSTVYTYALNSALARIAPILAMPATITDPFGRQMQLGYSLTGPGAPLSSIKIASLQVNFGYGSTSSLKSVSWSDGSSGAGTLNFVYENPAFPTALTGVVDEGGRRFATYGYDSQGRAFATSNGAGVNNFSARWDVAPVRQVATELHSNPTNSQASLRRTFSWGAASGTAVTEPNGQVGLIGTVQVLSLIHI